MQLISSMRYRRLLIGTALMLAASLGACDAGNTPTPRTSSSGGANTSGMQGSGAAAGSGGSSDERR